MNYDNMKDHISLCINNKDTLIFDFDHTLLEGNSTELFISHAQPKAFISLIDVIVRGLLPWGRLKVQHPHRLRDWVCVVLISLITPWNVILWRYRAPFVFRALENQEISTALSFDDKKNSIIISFGTRFVIKAMMAGSAWDKSTLIANPFFSRIRFFSIGKLGLARNIISEDQLTTATFITDSEDDRDLLDYSKTGILIAPQGKVRITSCTTYFPLRYTANVKYPRRYVLDQLIFVDIFLLALSCNFTQISWYIPVAVVPLLFIAVMCVYELGYYENDMKASVRETKPTLGERLEMYRQYPIAEGWLWAALLSIAGLGITATLQNWEAARLGTVAVGWAAALTGIRLIFRLYNSFKPEHRVHFYMLLQICKYMPLLIVFSISTLGAVILASQALTMWIHYVVYRSGGAPLYTSKNIVRLIVSATALGFIFISSSDINFFSAVMIIYIIWSALRLVVDRWVVR